MADNQKDELRESNDENPLQDMGETFDSFPKFIYAFVCKPIFNFVKQAFTSKSSANKMLIAGVREDSLEKISESLAKGADINCKANDGHFNFPPALHFARNFETLYFLVENGADVNVTSSFMNTYLHLFTDKEEVLYLIARGANVNARNYQDDTPLHRQTDPIVIEKLIAAGADVNARNHLGNTPLHVQTNPEVIEKLIAAGADVNARNHLGDTPLHMRKSPVEKIRILLAAGADVNSRNLAEQTPLHIITYNGKSVVENVEIMRALIAAGANVDACDDIGCTPLFYVTKADYQKELIKAGAKIDAENINGNTAFQNYLFILILQDNLETLLNAGTDPNHRNNSLRTSLHSLLEELGTMAYTDVIPVQAVKTLLAYGAKPYIKDSNGESCFDINQRHIQRSEHDAAAAEILDKEKLLRIS